MKLLMLSATFPYPPSRGGTQVRTFNLLKHLDSCQITLVTQATSDTSPADIEALAKWVHTLKVFPQARGSGGTGVLGKAMRFGQFVLEGTPPSVRHRYSAEMQAWIEQATQAQSFEVLTCEHSVNERYVTPLVEARVPRRVVNIHSSVYGTCKQQLASGTAENPLRDRLNLALLKRYEIQYCQKFTDLVVTTPEDAQQMRALCPQRPVHIVTNGVDLALFPWRPNDPGGRHLVFVGAMDNAPNIDAALFLSQEILPRVRQHYPDATLSLVGARPVAAIQALKALPGVVVTGQVPSMVDYLHQATVCVIPMRSGYGIKNKTLEAMAAGAPVVASDRGLEGLRVDGDGIPQRALRANHPQEYVAAIARLFEHPDLRQALSRQARTMIETDYTWQRIGQAYAHILTR